MTYLRVALEQDENLKRTEVSGRMIVAMCFANKPVAGDFPSEKQVRHRVNSMKYQRKKKSE